MPAVKTATLLPGDDGVKKQTVPAMIRLAKRDSSDPAIMKIVRNLLKESDGTDESYALAAFNYIVENVKYKKDKHPDKNGKMVDAEVVQAPKILLTKSKEGDCDCMITAFASLCMAQKIKGYIKTVAWKPDVKDQFTHVYCVIFLKESKVWIPCDPVAGKKGFGWQVSPRYREEYFSWF